jgi:hypothetical protein
MRGETDRRQREYRRSVSRFNAGDRGRGCLRHGIVGSRGVAWSQRAASALISRCSSAQRRASVWCSNACAARSCPSTRMTTIAGASRISTLGRRSNGCACRRHTCRSFLMGSGGRRKRGERPEHHDSPRLPPLWCAPGTWTPSTCSPGLAAVRSVAERGAGTRGIMAVSRCGSTAVRTTRSEVPASVATASSPGQQRSTPRCSPRLPRTCSGRP